MKQNKKVLGILIGAAFMEIIGCGDLDTTGKQEDFETTVKTSREEVQKESQETISAQIETTTQIMTEIEQVSSEIRIKDIDINPDLPSTGSCLNDFIPKYWELLDSVSLDFNEDGISDYVGVLDIMGHNINDEGTYRFIPRILFAIESQEEEQYKLSFQDVNLIRNRNEGGVFGDPYEPLTAEGSSFTTHSFGGSAWKWSEAYTYSYEAGDWYLTAKENWSGYGGFTTQEDIDDYKTGIGIRNRRSAEFEDMENWGDKEGYDLSYTVPLEESPTIYQAGMRWWLSPDRISEWPVDSIWIKDGLDLKKDMVSLPQDSYLCDYTDENYILYTFFKEDANKTYLASYQRQDKTLSILAEEESNIDNPRIYRDKIYYSSEIIESITHKNYEGMIVEEDEQIGIRLYRMNFDGSDRQAIFEYRLPDDEIMERQYFYIGLIYEISGGEIVAEVYIGDKPHPVYRMKLDGSDIEQIGQIPKESKEQ